MKDAPEVFMRQGIIFKKPSKGLFLEIESRAKILTMGEPTCVIIMKQLELRHLIGRRHLLKVPDTMPWGKRTLLDLMKNLKSTL